VSHPATGFKATLKAAVGAMIDRFHDWPPVRGCPGYSPRRPKQKTGLTFVNRRIAFSTEETKNKIVPKKKISRKILNR
jgi:hypothetical protein